MYIILQLNMPFNSIIARLHCQVCSIGCCYLQNGCQLHYHPADSVITSAWAFINLPIWIKIYIALAILGIVIMSVRLSGAKSSMSIYKSRWHTFSFGSVSSLIVFVWQRRRCRQVWHRIWCQLFELLWRRCTRTFPPPAWLGIVSGAILARKAAIHLIFPKYSWVSYHRSLHILIPRKLNSPLFLVSNFSQRFFD